MKIKNGLKWLLIAFVAAVGAAQIASASPQEVHDAKLKGEAKKLFQYAVQTRLPHFYNSKISEPTLRTFGAYYNGYTQRGSFKEVPNQGHLYPEDRTLRIQAKLVENAVQKFFGRSIKHASTRGFDYKNGYYYTPVQTFDCAWPGDFVLELVLWRHSNEQYVAYAKCSDLPDFNEKDTEYLSYMDKKRLDLKRVGTGANARFIITGWSPAK